MKNGRPLNAQYALSQMPLNLNPHAHVLRNTEKRYNRDAVTHSTKSRY